MEPCLNFWDWYEGQGSTKAPPRDRIQLWSTKQDTRSRKRHTPPWNIFEDGERQKDLWLRPIICEYEHETLCIQDFIVECAFMINAASIYLLEIRLT